MSGTSNNVPVGKDSMSMRTAWQEQDQDIGDSAIVANNYRFLRWLMCVKH